MKKKLNNKEYRENGIWVEIVLEGKELSLESTLENLTFRNDPNRRLIIYSNATILQNGNSIKRFDMIEEIKNFFTTEIRTATVKLVRFNRRTGDLEISLKVASGELEINVKESSVGESWQYNSPNGFIVY